MRVSIISGVADPWILHDIWKGVANGWSSWIPALRLVSCCLGGRGVRRGVVCFALLGHYGAASKSIPSYQYQLLSGWGGKDEGNGGGYYNNWTREIQSDITYPICPRPNLRVELLSWGERGNQFATTGIIIEGQSLLSWHVLSSKGYMTTRYSPAIKKRERERERPRLTKPESSLQKRKPGAGRTEGLGNLIVPSPPLTEWIYLQVWFEFG